MANNFDSNFTRKLLEGMMPSFESERVISKNVNTQKLDGKFNPNSGDTVDFKRATDYRSSRTSKGDVSGETKSDILTGKASGVVQDYITVFMDYDEADEAIKMGNVEEILRPAAQRIVTDLELDFAEFAMLNSGLLSGTPGTAVTTWDQVANAGAMLEASGVPRAGGWNYVMNSFTQRKLASDQRSLGGETGNMTANEQATITNNFAGMKVLTATTLANFTTDAAADRAGTLSGTPVATYLAAKDTMTQQLAVTGFGANMTVKAGEQIQIAGRSRLNLATRQPFIDDAGAKVLWTGTVTADVVLGASGDGTLIVTGPAIFETLGQYNTVDSAPTSGDVVTLLGAASAIIQPNMFFHKEAFAIGSVPIKKLHSTDTIATTKDGLQIRCSKGSDFLANKQQVRFDLRPAYAALNPFFAGHGHG